MANRQDIVGAMQVLRAAGIDIVGDNRRSPEVRDFGAGYDDYEDVINGDDDDDDDVSGADIIGAIIGAARGQRLSHKQKKALKQFAKQKKQEGKHDDAMMLAKAMAGANKPGVRRDEDFVLRGLVLGMGTVAVPAGGVNKLSARAQEAIRIQRIELDPNGASFANQFVSSIVVGVRPQSANLQEMPLVSFAFNATGSYLRGNTVDRGQDFEINLRNGSLIAINVTGVVFGESLQP